MDEINTSEVEQQGGGSYVVGVDMAKGECSDVVREFSPDALKLVRDSAMYQMGAAGTKLGVVN